MDESDNTYKKQKLRVSDLSNKELGQLLRINFFKIGIRLTGASEPSIDELNTMIAEVKKWQGKIPIDIFEHVFSLVQSGELVVKERRAFTPWYVSCIMKAQAQLAFGPKSQKKSTPEGKWFHVYERIKSYGIVPEELDWPTLWNYAVSKGWLKGATTPLTPIPEGYILGVKQYEMVKDDVMDLLYSMYGKHIRTNQI